MAKRYFFSNRSTSRAYTKRDIARIARRKAAMVYKQGKDYLLVNGSTGKVLAVFSKQRVAV
jgi:translation elongation factor P/translation initiation factor 5A